MGISIPFALYDFLGVLFPGVLAIAVVPVVYPPATASITALLRDFSFFALVIGYITGEIVQALARAFENKVLRVLWRAPSKWEVLPAGLRTRLEQIAREHYGLGESIPAKDFSRDQFDLLYSIVWDRMDNYRLFVAKADFSRAIAMVMALGCLGVLYFGHAAPLGPAWNPGVKLLVGLLGLALSALLFSRARRFRELADGVVYFSALQRAAELRNLKPHDVS